MTREEYELAADRCVLLLRVAQLPEEQEFVAVAGFLEGVGLADDDILDDVMAFMSAAQSGLSFLVSQAHGNSGSAAQVAEIGRFVDVLMWTTHLYHSLKFPLRLGAPGHAFETWLAKAVSAQPGGDDA